MFFISATIAFNLVYSCVVMVLMFFIMLTIGRGRRMRFTTLIDVRGRYVWAVLLPDNLLAYDRGEFCVALVAVRPT